MALYAHRRHHERPSTPPLECDVDEREHIERIDSCLRPHRAANCPSPRSATCTSIAMYLVRATHHGTLAAPVCAIRTTRRCPNRHSVCALNTSRGVRRGFLPRGLCDTCPQVMAARRCVVRAGQVLHNPKQLLTFKPRWRAAGHGREREFEVEPETWLSMRELGRPGSVYGHFRVNPASARCGYW